MSNQVTLSGLPSRLAQDAWWLDAEPSTLHASGRGQSSTAQREMRPVLGLLFVVMLADALFWHGGFGVSVAIFACGLCVAAVAGARHDADFSRAAVFVALGAAPAVEYVQLLSVVFLLIGTVMAIATVRFPQDDIGQIIARAAGFLRYLPVAWALVPVSAGVGLANTVSSAGRGGALAAFRRNWAFPIGGAFVFGALLIAANPVIGTLDLSRIDDLGLVQRGMFWGGTALMVWPFLVREKERVVTVPDPSMQITRLGVNAGSVLRALWLFNGLIAVQTLLDLSIIFGGTALPPGMSYAEYAHRGAYPLLAMALLAGAFAVAAQPYLNENASMRPLMYLWLGQNIVVCGSALLRLDLYIDVYGLTYMRIYAQVWMCLVAAGLALTVWQVYRDHATAWLLIRCAILGASVLYGACFVNVAKIIVDYNMTLAEPDTHYLCRLNPTSGLYRYAEGLTPVDPYDWCYVRTPHIANWQSWGFRTWRALP